MANEVHAQPRTVTGKKVRALRRDGIVPANVFGHGESRAIQAADRDLEAFLAHGGRTGLVTVYIGGEQQPALVKHVQRDPRTAKLQHIDFQAVSLNQRITSAVPLRFVGESAAVAKLDGVLLHPTTEIQVESLAREIPDAIEVDLAVLEELGTSIKAGDLILPKGATLAGTPDDVVAMVQAPKVEAEVEEAPTEEAAAEEGAEAPAEEEATGEAAADEEKSE